MRVYRDVTEAFQGHLVHNTPGINKGISSKRVLHNPIEMYFARAWVRENMERPGYNFGRGILQDLFTERVGFDGKADPWGRPRAVKIISKRERMIVATVIQWLGSNVGFDFLRCALDECGYRLEKK